MQSRVHCHLTNRSYLCSLPAAAAKLAFASNPVVAIHNGNPTLMLRIGNGRVGALTGAAAKLNVFFVDTTADGMPIRRAQDLRLERGTHPHLYDLTTLMRLSVPSPCRPWQVAQARLRARAPRSRRVRVASAARARPRRD
jgi:hypothetical protein